MKILIDTSKLKLSLSQHHLSDLVLYMAWIFIHLGMFSALKAEEFFIYAGVINFICALLYKFYQAVINGK